MQKNNSHKHRTQDDMFNKHVCMSHMCNCNNPNHRCPAHIPRHEFSAKTKYTEEFVPKSPTRPEIIIAKNNLKPEKGFNGNTVYRDEFKNQESKSQLIKKQNADQRIKDIIYQNNVQSHIKDIITGTTDKYDNFRGHREDRYVYSKPQEFIHQKEKRNDRVAMNATTQYRNDFKQRPVSANTGTRAKPINYDNLVAYNPNIKFNATTNYRAEHAPKSPDIKRNNELFNIAKANNQRTNMFIGQGNPFLETEYRNRFVPSHTQPVDCPLNRMPKVPKDLYSKPNHVYYNPQNDNWETSNCTSNNR